MNNQFDHRSGEHLQIDDAKIYYEIKGGSELPVLLFLHGGFGNIEDFNPILPLIEKDFRILGIDSRGQGKSTLGTEKLTYERIEKDVESVLRHLGIDRLSIFGFSDGGIVAYRLASFGSIKIDKLATVGATWHSKSLALVKDFLANVTGDSWREKFPETYEAYQNLNPEPDFDRLAESMVAMWLDESASGHPNEAIEKINSPLLIARGDKDHLVAREVVFELAETIKDANLFNIPFAGHVAFTDQKEIFMSGLNDFLRK